MLVLRLRPIRLLALGGILLLGLLYWKPLHTYMSTGTSCRRAAPTCVLCAAEKAELERRIAQAGTAAALVREARLIGYVKPGERLFIVRGISTWRQRQK